MATKKPCPPGYHRMPDGRCMKGASHPSKSKSKSKKSKRSTY